MSWLRLALRRTVDISEQSKIVETVMKTRQEATDRVFVELHREGFEPLAAKVVQYDWMSRYVTSFIFGHGPNKVLLLPGSLGTFRTDFKDLINGLDPQLFTLITYDPPGFGLSLPPSQRYQLLYRRDLPILQKLMSKLKQDLAFQQYNVLGWDAGCESALLLAANHTTGTEINRVIAVGYARTQLSRTLDTEHFSSRTGTVMKYFSRLTKRFKADVLTKADLQKVECPVVIIRGENDPICRQQELQYLRKNIKFSIPVQLPKTQHDPHISNPKQFNELITKYLTSELIFN